MKWLILGMLALGLACLGFGVWDTQQGASADERVGGVLPILLGASIIVVDLVVAFIWLFAQA